MRRAIVLVLMISLLLLPGCGAGEQWEERLTEKRQTFAGCLSFTADVTADLGDSIFECTLACTYANGQAEVTVLSPELAAGICAKTGENGTTLEFDGVELVVGSLDASGLSPMSAMPLLMQAIMSGHVTKLYAEKNEDGETAAAEIYMDEEHSALVRFDAQSFDPVYAELIYEGRAVIKCAIQNFNQ